MLTILSDCLSPRALAGIGLLTIVLALLVRHLWRARHGRP